MKGLGYILSADRLIMPSRIYIVKMTFGSRQANRGSLALEMMSALPDGFAPLCGSAAGRSAIVCFRVHSRLAALFVNE